MISLDKTNNLNVPSNLNLSREEYVAAVQTFYKSGILFGYSLETDSYVLAAINNKNETKCLPIPNISKVFTQLSVQEIVQNTLSLFSDSFDNNSIDADSEFDWLALDPVRFARYQEIALTLGLVEDCFLLEHKILPVSDSQLIILEQLAVKNKRLALALGPEYMQKLESWDIKPEFRLQNAPDPLGDWKTFIVNEKSHESETNKASQGHVIH